MLQFVLADVKSLTQKKSYTILHGARFIFEKKVTYKIFNDFEILITKNFYEITDYKIIIASKLQVENDKCIEIGEYKILFELENRILIPHEILSFKFNKIDKKNNIIEAGDWELEYYLFCEINCNSEKKNYNTKFKNEAKRIIEEKANKFKVKLI